VTAFETAASSHSATPPRLRCSILAETSFDSRGHGVLVSAQDP